jgi:hypothetical protein
LLVVSPEGEEALFEKKMTKEEKKAAAKAAREAKKKAKVCPNGFSDSKFCSFGLG